MKKKVIESNISISSFNSFIDYIFETLIPQKSSYVCFANVHSLITAYKTSEFNTVLNNCDFVAADGRAITIYLKLFKGINQDRIAGMDVMPKLLEQANQNKNAIYFYGSTQDTLNKIKVKLDSEYPNINVVGMYSPPFRVLSEEEQKTITNSINSLNPDLVLVSLGCPKQEFWMASKKDKIFSCMLGLGQAFKTFSGEEGRLPKSVRNFKWFPIEWLYRLWHEPKRLWKRFLYSNSLFIWLISKEAFKNLRRKLIG